MKMKLGSYLDITFVFCAIVGQIKGIGDDFKDGVGYAIV